MLARNPAIPNIHDVETDLTEAENLFRAVDAIGRAITCDPGYHGDAGALRTIASIGLQRVAAIQKLVFGQSYPESARPEA